MLPERNPELADISRTDAEALLSTQDVGPIIQAATESSVALRTFRTVRMASGQARMPVLSALPTAGFVTESATDAAGLKPTSEVTWENKELIAEEIAVIVPIHENVLADANYDLVGEIRPLVASELGRVLDAAVLFGTNKPSTWADDALVPGAIAAGNNYTSGSGTIGDLAEDVNATWALVEADGFDVNVNYAARSLRASLRGLRDGNNHPMYLDNFRSDGASATIMGEDIFYVTNGAWDATEAVLIAGDRSKAILGIRQDLQVKVLTEATLDLGGGTLIHLAQRDMVGLRFKFRVAFATAAPVAPGQGADPYPFAVLRPVGS